MAQDLDLQELFTVTCENTTTDPAISAADTVSADALASQDDTTSRRLRPRRAKPTTANESDRAAPSQSIRPNRSTARNKKQKILAGQRQRRRLFEGKLL